MNIRGSRLRRVDTVEVATRYYSIATLTCGHVAVRLNHLAPGQRVFCQKCPPREIASPVLVR